MQTRSIDPWREPAGFVQAGSQGNVALPLSLIPLGDGRLGPALGRSIAFDLDDMHSASSYRADVAACRAVLRVNSRTFHAASLLLPPSVRDPASVLYGFCRLADDAVDLDGGRLDAVEHLADRINRAYAGNPMAVPADRALAVVVARYAIPQSIPLALVEGLEWDARGRRYNTIDELLDYAARVAGTVGAMMALLMGADSRPALARACDLGVAMQLSNIARDVGEDARMGRIYLPLDWVREAGVDPDEWLANPRFTPAIGSVVQRLLKVAEQLYGQVGAGVAQLPLACRPGINAARFLYAEIGGEVARAGHDSVNRRAVVPSAVKLRLLLRSALHVLPRRPADDTPPLTANRMLVQAACGCSAAAGHKASSSPAWWDVQGRFIALVTLFDRLERRDQMRRYSSN